MDRLFVIGYPSRLGGADTELDHQIHCWQALGIHVHVIPTGTLDANLRAMRLEERGCVVHPPRDWKACRKQHVIAYCNGEFLANIGAIRHFARSTTFVNCMCWLFDKEKEAHSRGQIDYFLYQTDHARLRVQDELIGINASYRWHKVRPYFHLVDFPYVADRPTDKFRFGRISREDRDKFHKAQFWVYETMVAPVIKEGIVLGFSETIREKCGPAPDWVTTYPAGGISVGEFYRKIDCLIQMTDTYENLPRIGFEAMASGSLLVVDDRGGWKELVQHGETGFLCRDQRDFVYYASRAAYELAERKRMAAAAREWLTANWGMESAKQEWARFFTVLAQH